MRHPLRNLTRPGRRGATAVTVALLLVPLFGFVALCVDLGWIALTKSELQNAADSSAAAGARQLVDNYSDYLLPTQPNKASLVNGAKQAATTFGTQFGSYNRAGGSGALTILANDIQFGFTDASGNYQPLAVRGGYPNTIQVVARRDSSANGRLPLFIAPLIGKRDTALTATASSTIYTGLISSFDPQGSPSGAGSEGEDGGAWGDDYSSDGSGSGCSLLPVAFDVYNWVQFTSTGTSPDGAVHLDSTGAAEIKIYPSPQQAPGNFGLLCIGTYTNSTPGYRNWILNGPSDGDLSFLDSAGAFPVSMASPKPWKGSPGLHNALKSAFEAIVGQPRLLPLFKPASLVPYQAASGHGANATYNIVGFAGVMVTKVTGNGGNLDISVQPCSVIDPCAVFDPSTIYPAGAEPLTQLKTFTHVSPKFTR